MNQVGSDSYLWHLQQAAIQETIARGSERRGFYLDAEKARDKAQWHRDRAAILDRENRMDAA